MAETGQSRRFRPISVVSALLPVTTRRADMLRVRRIDFGRGSILRLLGGRPQFTRLPLAGSAVSLAISCQPTTVNRVNRVNSKKIGLH